MKTIAQFRVESKGLFLDVVDLQEAVFVNTKTGNVQLNEELADNQDDVFFVEPSIDVLFWVEESGDDQWNVLLRVDRQRVQLLGITRDLKAAVRWITLANQSVNEIRTPPKLSDLTTKERELISRLSDFN